MWISRFGNAFAEAGEPVEIEHLLDTAGVARKAQVHWRFPFRYCIERVKW